MIKVWLFNKLFGWDYVYPLWVNINDSIVRVKKFPDNKVVILTKSYWRIFHDPKDVVWITCHPSKYFPLDR